MKYISYIILFFIAGCNKTHSNLEEVAIQHIGKGIMNGDACKTLYREDGRAVTSPQNFKISPFDAIAIAKEKLNYSCGHSFGAQILSDGNSYYIVRGLMENAIIINGENGVVESKGFMGKKK